MKSKFAGVFAAVVGLTQAQAQTPPAPPVEKTQAPENQAAKPAEAQPLPAPTPGSAQGAGAGAY